VKQQWGLTNKEAVAGLAVFLVIMGAYSASSRSYRTVLTVEGEGEFVQVDEPWWHVVLLGVGLYGWLGAWIYVTRRREKRAEKYRREWLESFYRELPSDEEPGWQRFGLRRALRSYIEEVS